MSHRIDTQTRYGADGTLRFHDHPDAPPAALADSAMFYPATRQVAAKVCAVAEIGVNHDGDVKRALWLVQAAARAGADAVKLQLFDPRHLLSNQARLADYQVDNLHAPRDSSDNAVFDMLDQLMLSFDDMLAVKAAARQAGLYFIVTPFSLENFDALQSLDVDAVKIASPDAVNYPLLERVASLGRPMIVSTGTCELEELKFAAELIRNHPAGGCMLQCVSSYPTPAQDAALGGIRAIANRYSLPVGYSDHATDIAMGGLAVAAGACVLEKHITYSCRADGPDHAASFEPENFGMYTMIAKQAAQLVGPVAKHVHRVEADVRKVSRQSVCVIHDLPAGHVLTESDLTVKRPGTGIPAARLPELFGRRLRHAISANDILRDADVAHEKDVA